MRKIHIKYLELECVSAQSFLRERRHSATQETSRFCTKRITIVFTTARYINPIHILKTYLFKINTYVSHLVSTFKILLRYIHVWMHIMNSALEIPVHFIPYKYTRFSVRCWNNERRVSSVQCTHSVFIWHSTCSTKLLCGALKERLL